MNNSFTFWLILFVCSFLSAAAQNRDKQWAAAEKAIKNEQPKTALKHLNAIENAALTEEAWGEAGKAILLALTQEYRDFGKIEAAQAADAKLAKAPEQLAPILRTLSASLYYRYYQYNRWQILSRTNLLSGPEQGNDDPATWGLDRLLREIDQRLQESLKEAQPLQSLSLIHI